MPYRETFPPVTMGHIRSHGCRDLLVYCGAIGCNHSAEMDGNRFDDDLPIAALDRRMICTRCGHCSADLRPDWRPHVERSRREPRSRAAN